MLVALLWACSDSNVDPTTPDDTPSVTDQIVATGSDGTAVFPGANLRVRVRDVVTGQSLTGIHAILFESNGEEGLLLVDTSGHYEPFANLLSEIPVQGLGHPNVMHTSASTIDVELLIASAVDAATPGGVWVTNLVLTRPMWEHLLQTYADCETTTLGSAAEAVRAAALEFAVEAVVISAIDFLVGTRVGAALTLPNTAVSVSALQYNSVILTNYLASGYQADAPIDVCAIEASAVPLFDDWIILLPRDEPENRPPGTAFLRGTVRDAFTVEPIEDALVRAVGPNLNVTTTGSDGGYTFPNLVPSEYFLTAQAAGYVPTGSRVTIEGTVSVERDLAMNPAEQPPTLLFSEDFSDDLSQWSTFGSPVPSIDSSVGDPSPSLNINGDGSFASGANSNTTFTFVDTGLRLEWKSLRPDLPIGTFFTNSAVGLWEFAAEDFCCPYYVGIEYRPDRTGEFAFWYNGTQELSSFTITERRWISYRIDIETDGTARYYVDGDLVFESPQPVQLPGERPIVIQGRRHWIDEVGLETLDVN